MKTLHPLTIRPFDVLSAGISRSCQYEINGQDIALARIGIGIGTLTDYGPNGDIGSVIIHRQGEIRLNDETSRTPVFRNKYSI